ncbi:HEPN-associated N-terminal domain-containing protein [Pseudobutyrivibrio sp.]|uniref:HEPN-associated N-terminal domain-containing protein n=1 Tax=Pseudobutyrivibrio sp. TaxID=2014367 RepID=UPI0025DE0A3E|nr:HEPN-associated N-terminal domain-containing protein [Pseudobutyrivibrio sp.]MBR5650323.1 RES domain-containing protein [Pseudobutyrivibrio sp.]
MIKDSYCCTNCFNNKYIKKFIENNVEEEGDCPYCASIKVQMISLETMGKYLRDCIEKAYEGCDDGTGAMYDSEEKKYLGPDGEEATTYSIREILIDEEMILNDDTIETSLLDDLFENLYSYREIQKGAVDLFDDIDSPMWVIKDDLYGGEQTRVFHAWESFKHIIKHYGRFFEPQGFNLREDYLGRMDPYIYEFITDVPSRTIFYRAREIDDDLLPIERIEPYSQMGPPPAVNAKTNRMSPAGIPYLYLASDQETTLKECRIDSGKEAVIAEFISKKEHSC